MLELEIKPEIAEAVQKECQVHEQQAQAGAEALSVPASWPLW